MKAWYYHQALRAQRTAPEHRPQLYSAMNVDVLECFVVIYLIYICLIKFTVGSLSSWHFQKYLDVNIICCELYKAHTNFTSFPLGKLNIPLPSYCMFYIWRERMQSLMSYAIVIIILTWFMFPPFMNHREEDSFFSWHFGVGHQIHWTLWPRIQFALWSCLYKHWQCLQPNHRYRHSSCSYSSTFEHIIVILYMYRFQSHLVFSPGIQASSQHQ